MKKVYYSEFLKSVYDEVMNVWLIIISASNIKCKVISVLKSMYDQEYGVAFIRR